MTATHRLTSLTVLVGVFALTPNLTARQTAALKDLMPKGMVVGVALNQRQSDGVDTAAVEIVTKQFNQISPFWGLSDADSWLNRGRTDRMKVRGSPVAYMRMP